MKKNTIRFLLFLLTTTAVLVTRSAIAVTDNKPSGLLINNASQLPSKPQLLNNKQQKQDQKETISVMKESANQQQQQQLQAEQKEINEINTSIEGAEKHNQVP